jgi:hypothetical protein
LVRLVKKRIGRSMERLKEKRNEEGISEKEKRKNIEVEVRSSI